MSDIIGGLGSVAEGGLFSRALEPSSGAKDAHPDQPDECLNCGTPLTGAYCQACGQRGHLHRTIGGFVHDLLHGALHLDGKLWRTLPMLIFRPGRLTRRYIDGKRARFVSPMALFLFSVFLMFAVFQVVGITAPTEFNPEQPAQQTIEQARDQLTVLQEQVEQPELTEAERQELTDQITALETAIEAGGQLVPAEGGLTTSQDEDGTFRADLSEDGNTRMTMNATGIDTIDELLVNKWNDNPGLMLYKLQANAYKFSWLLIPISIPFVWLLFFWKRRFKAYDHAIFVTYSLSFMTLLFVTLSVLGVIGVPVAVLVISGLLIPILHIYKQLKYTYELSRWGAFWRTFTLTNLIVFIVVMIFVWLLFLLGAF
ncbi:DUF3667 domain-containing protein [Aurantiacibacter sp. D1-12]|uniref:DUF3667 domain-containing protein n=1 Tax=Aurantiacibacter sp. D1-12 TaxID=2993658 RepID=UPI00237CD4D0|nr:DUF3667 domain-containing protein [Aurantiacibacter sp. D1-12]MDE1467264.1 DUF3667 domain-containing protein [Aurantiacibacter sp. D1-12]